MHGCSTERVARTGGFGQPTSIGVLSCEDSRVPLEMVCDDGVDNLFVVRVSGNSAVPAASGAVERGVARSEST